jgi:catechol 2,3-dioxygenase-like lactoylglutathione lyase family enzyme
MGTVEQKSGIEGGVATVFARDMDKSVTFYTETLGLKLQFRAGDHWAQVDAGSGFLIGIHPAEPGAPTGVSGGVQIGLSVKAPIQQVVDELKSRGVVFEGDIHIDANGGVKLAFFKDPDGNELYLCETSY